jgi:hypothetical protein
MNIEREGTDLQCSRKAGYESGPDFRVCGERIRLEYKVSEGAAASKKSLTIF